MKLGTGHVPCKAFVACIGIKPDNGVLASVQRAQWKWEGLEEMPGMEEGNAKKPECPMGRV